MKINTIVVCARFDILVLYFGILDICVLCW
jgi:hypothetical protein